MTNRSQREATDREARYLSQTYPVGCTVTLHSTGARTAIRGPFWPMPDGRILVQVDGLVEPVHADDIGPDRR